MSDLHLDEALSRSPPSPPPMLGVDATLPFELFCSTPFQAKEECTVYITVQLSSNVFSLALPNVAAIDAQNKLRRCADSLSRKARKARKPHASDRAKSPERTISPGPSGRTSSRRTAKSPERQNSETKSRAKSPESGSSPSRAPAPVVTTADYDPGLVCRSLEDQLSRFKGKGNVLIPPNIEECFSLILRSFLSSPGLFTSGLSNRAINAFDRYLRILYRGQSIFSIEQTSKLHYEEPNLVAHLLLRYFKELPRSLLTTADLPHFVDQSDAYLVDIFTSSSRKNSPEMKLLFGFLRVLWTILRNHEYNGVTSRDLAFILGPIFFRTAPDGTLPTRPIEVEASMKAVSFLLDRGFEVIYRCSLAELNAHAQTFRRLTASYPQLSRLLLDADMALFRVLTDLMEPSLAGSLAPSILRFLRRNSCAVVFISRLVSKELAENNQPSTYFRSNNLGTQLLSAYCKEIGADFLKETLSLLLQQLSKVDGSFEVKPSPSLSATDLQDNQQRLHAYLALFFNMIITALPSLPEQAPGIGQISHQMVAMSSDTNFRSVILGAFIFLRFLCPALVSPEGFDLVEPGLIKPHVRNGLISISKVLQHMSNRTKLKEQHMQFLQGFIDENMSVLSAVFDQVSRYGETHPCAETLPALPYADFEACLGVHSYLAENLAEVDEAVREMGPNVVQTFKQVQMLLVEMPPPPQASEAQTLSSLPAPSFLQKTVGLPSQDAVVVATEPSNQAFWVSSSDGEFRRHFPAGVVQAIATAASGIVAAAVDSALQLWVASSSALSVWAIASGASLHSHPIPGIHHFYVAGDAVLALAGTTLFAFSANHPTSAPRSLQLPARPSTSSSSSTSSTSSSSSPSSSSSSSSSESDLLVSLALSHQNTLWILQGRSVQIVDMERFSKRAFLSLPAGKCTNPQFVLPVSDTQMWLIDASGHVCIFDSKSYQLIHQWTMEVPSSCSVTAAHLFDNTLWYGLSDGRIGLLDPVLFLECTDLPHVLTAPIVRLHHIWNPQIQHWEVVAWSANDAYASWLPPTQLQTLPPAAPLPEMAPLRPGSDKPASAPSSSSIDAIARITIQYAIIDPRNPMSKLTKSVICTVSSQNTIEVLIASFTHQLHHQGKKDFQEVMVVNSEGSELESTDFIRDVWKKGEILFAELF